MKMIDSFNLIVKNTSEVVSKSDLRMVLQKKEKITGYIGVEPSGLFHVGWMIWIKKIKDFLDAGIDFIFLEATWHAWINNKLGGNLEDIRTCALYIKHCLISLGVDIKKMRFIRAEDLINDPEYWSLVIKVAKRMSLSRAKRAMTIMGRKERESSTDLSMLVYPIMQVADIFYLDLDICLGGTDQRKAHILAREIAKKLNFKKPVGVHTPLLIGLEGFNRMDYTHAINKEIIELKMSKSKPETCIFIHDSYDEIYKKIFNAFCPAKQVLYNPIIDLNKYLLFEENFKLMIERPKKNDILKIESFEDLERKYLIGEIHPLDLKNATAKALSEKLENVRLYFERNTDANKIFKKLDILTKGSEGV